MANQETEVEIKVSWYYCLSKSDIVVNDLNRVILDEFSNRLNLFHESRGLVCPLTSFFFFN